MRKLSLHSQMTLALRDRENNSGRALARPKPKIDPRRGVRDMVGYEQTKLIALNFRATLRKLGVFTRAATTISPAPDAA
jgi:hypothetical protein